MQEPCNAQLPQRQPWETAAIKQSWDAFSAFREKHKDTPTLCAGAIWGAAWLDGCRHGRKSVALVEVSTLEGASERDWLRFLDERRETKTTADEFLSIWWMGHLATLGDLSEPVSEHPLSTAPGITAEPPASAVSPTVTSEAHAEGSQDAQVSTRRACVSGDGR